MQYLLDDLVIKLPQIESKGIMDWDKTDDDKNIIGKQYVLSILLNPLSDDGLYRMINDIYVACFTHLYNLHREEKLSYVEDDILDIINFDTLDGARGTKGMLMYPIKFPVSSRVGKIKTGKVLEDATGYLSLNISESGYYQTRFIVPNEVEPEEYTLDEMMEYSHLEHVPYLSLSRIFIGQQIKSLKFYLRQLYMLGHSDGSAGIIDLETNNELAIENRERLESLRDRRENSSRNDIPVDYMDPSHRNESNDETESLSESLTRGFDNVDQTGLPPIIPLD